MQATIVATPLEVAQALLELAPDAFDCSDRTREQLAAVLQYVKDHARPATTEPVLAALDHALPVNRTAVAYRVVRYVMDTIRVLASV